MKQSWRRLIGSSAVTFGLVAGAQLVAPMAAHAATLPASTIHETSCPANSMGAQYQLTSCAFSLVNGDEVQVSFTLPQGTTEQLSLAAYSNPDNNIANQTLRFSATGTFTGNGQTQSMTVDLPMGVYQVDLVHGGCSTLLATNPVYGTAYVGAAYGTNYGPTPVVASHPAANGDHDRQCDHNGQDREDHPQIQNKGDHNHKQPCLDIHGQDNNHADNHSQNNNKDW